MRKPALLLVIALLGIAMFGCTTEKLTPEQRILLGYQADSAYQAGNYQLAGDLYSAVVKAGSLNPDNAYNAACSYALANDRARMMKMMETALRLGYHNVEWFEQDPDFEPIRSLPEWNGFLSRAKQNREEYMKRVNRELYDICNADQADRQLDWSSMPREAFLRIIKRDSLRLARVREIIEEGTLILADDYFHAALVLQHGLDSSAYRQANEMARKAVELNPEFPDGRWLVAATKDRWLVSIGQPQIYGTQRYFRDGRWTTEPFDTTVISDGERRLVGISPFRDILARVEKLNEKAETE